jgi:FKBP-type peptidyl-prolyl cis-trans isomerase
MALAVRHLKWLSMVLAWNLVATFSAGADDITLAEKNLKTANQQLADNLQRKGVVQTASGLQYKILKQGDGCRPTANAEVTVHYDARLAKAKQPFDSSYARGEPGTYPLNRMILAWREGIPLMQTGAIWEFYVPPALAYGSKGSMPVIQPNVVTIFKVELLHTDLCQ